MRTRNFPFARGPSWARAASHAASAETREPRWSGPLGVGAKRPTYAPSIGSRKRRLALGRAAQPPICFSRISSSVLQSMHCVAVGRASSRCTPISAPQSSQ